MNQINPRLSILKSALEASRTDELCQTDQLLVRSYRSWIKGLHENDSRPWNDVWNAFIAEFGARDGKLALTWFVRMINALQAHAERPVRYHQPGCPCLGDDERQFLGVVAACRAGAALAARERAETLVPVDGAKDLLAAGGQLALIMAKVGHTASLPGEPALGDFNFADLHALPPMSMALN